MRIIANMVVVRSMEFPPYMTTAEIEAHLLAKLKATFEDKDTSCSVGIVELPADPPPQPTGE